MKRSGFSNPKIMLDSPNICWHPIWEMKKPTRYQVGSFYSNEERNVGRAVAVSARGLGRVWTLESYDGSTFDVAHPDLFVAKKKDMKHWHRAARTYAK